MIENPNEKEKIQSFFSLKNVEQEKNRIYSIIFEKHHILLFVVTIWFLLYLSEISFLKSHFIFAYQVAAFSAAYQYMNTNITIYNLLGSAFIASFIAYFIYQSFHKYVSIVWLNALITLFVVVLTDYAKCFTISGLIYALIAVKEIPRIKIGYLFSYIFACVAIVFFYFLFTNVVSFLQTKFHLFEHYDLLIKKWY